MRQAADWFNSASFNRQFCDCLPNVLTCPPDFGPTKAVSLFEGTEFANCDSVVIVAESPKTAWIFPKLRMSQAAGLRCTVFSY